MDEVKLFDLEMRMAEVEKAITAINVAITKMFCQGLKTTVNESCTHFMDICYCKGSAIESCTNIKNEIYCKRCGGLCFNLESDMNCGSCKLIIKTTLKEGHSKKQNESCANHE